MSVKANDANFEEEVINSAKPVIVDFYADWCGPCKMMSPVLDEIADEDGNIKVVKVNVDEAPETAEKYNVMTIPMFLFVKDKNVVDTVVGAVPKEMIVEKIAKM